MPRLSTGCAIALALTACAPASALAARVTHVPGSTVAVYAADPGEANRVTVGAVGSALTVTDAGVAALATAGDCVPVDARTASCPVAGVAVLELTGGDRNDELANASAVPAQADGGEGDDLLLGGPAADTLAGGAGDDTLRGLGGDDRVLGGEGEDVLAGGPGSDEVAGGPGRDAVAYVARWPVTVDLTAATGGNALFGDRDRLVGLEDVAGGDQPGTVMGTAGPNDLAGGLGEDYLDGRRGVDRLAGGDGPDVVAARDGARDEAVSCGPGLDFAIVDRDDSVARRGGDRCEQVDDGRQTTPRPGRVYLRPRRCSRREEDAQLRLPEMQRSVPLRYAIGLLTGYAGRPAPLLAAARCSVRLTATPGRGRPPASIDVSGDAAAVSQTGRRLVTTALTVQRAGCSHAARAAAGAGDGGERRVRTRSRGTPRGRWQVRGPFSIAASQGTDFTTVEDCSGTRTIVHSGRVRVFDRGTQRSVVVSPGRSYLARSAG
jgi:hypothetical protein